MKKKIRIVLVMLITICLLSCYAHPTVANSPFIPTEGLSITQFFDDYEEIDNALAARQDKCHEMAECARELGLDDVVTIAQAEWQSAQNDRQQNTETISSWLKAYETYPYATYIWLYLTRTLGYSNVVAAGVLGNIMAEVGGGTLNIRYWLYGFDDPDYYGMCQWHKNWYSEVMGTDLIYQCDFLASTIVGAMDRYEAFLNSSNPADAALIFAQEYEKCASYTYQCRQEYALVAYEYFTYMIWG